MITSQARSHYLSIRRQRDWTRYGPVIRQIATLEWNAARFGNKRAPASEAFAIIREAYRHRL